MTATRTRVKIFRWRGVVPLLLVLALVAVAYWLLADRLVKRSVEHSGTAFVGARVDLAEADIRLADGVVMLRGLQVTNPQKPMTNLFEADQIVVNVRMAPLLEKKVIIDTVALRGLRFGTPRRTSGAVDRPPGPAGEMARAVDEWRRGLPIPSFSMEGLRQVVNVDAITADSLATLRQARALAGAADSARADWLARLQRLDPRPEIDSATALARRLEGQTARTLGLAGARDAVTSARRTLTALGTLDDRLAALQAGIDSGVGRAKLGIADLAEARRQDYAYARGLLKLPSLDAPSLGPALFGQFAAEQVAPVLYWLGLAERYAPPGVQARLRQGPDRVRRSGQTVLFPKREQLPKFLLRVAEASLEIERGAATGAYAARITDVTTAPALIGRPTTFQAGRTGGRVGPETVRIGGILNHVGRPLRDSVNAFVGGLALPSLTLAPIGTRLDLGRGTTELVLGRTGDSLDARLAWRSTDVRWERLAGAAPARDTTARVLPDQLSAQALGQAARRSAEDIAWRVISGLNEVRIDARLTGSVRRPRLAVGTNVARALGDGLREQLGAQLRNAEADVRARVDALVAERVTQAQDAVRAYETQALERVAAERARLDQAKRELEARVRALATGVPGVGG